MAHFGSHFSEQPFYIHVVNVLGMISGLFQMYAGHLGYSVWRLLVLFKSPTLAGSCWCQCVDVCDMDNLAWLCGLLFQCWLCLQSPSFALLVSLVLWHWWGHSVPADRCISRVHPAEDTWNVFLCFCDARQLHNSALQSLLAPFVQAGSGEPAGALTLSRGIDCGMILEHSSRSLLGIVLGLSCHWPEKEWVFQKTYLYLLATVCGRE